MPNEVGSFNDALNLAHQFDTHTRNTEDMTQSEFKTLTKHLPENSQLGGFEEALYPDSEVRDFNKNDYMREFQEVRDLEEGSLESLTAAWKLKNRLVIGREKRGVSNGEIAERTSGEFALKIGPDIISLADQTRVTFLTKSSNRKGPYKYGISDNPEQVPSKENLMAIYDAVFYGLAMRKIERLEADYILMDAASRYFSGEVKPLIESGKLEEGLDLFLEMGRLIHPPGVHMVALSMDIEEIVRGYLRRRLSLDNREHRIL